ncbi:MAG: CDP-alcohol phosphatidyltransferase family protein [Actinomycetota bacterium]
MHPGGTQRPLEQAAAEPDPGSRIATIPNALSMARLAGVPFFLWLALGPRTSTADAWAVVLLFAAGATDWLDGKIARALNQQSRLGELLDPAADRLYIVATLIALAIRAIIPWWLVGLLVARELVLAASLLRLRAGGYGPLQVSFAGKAATMFLFYAFPLLLLGAHPGSFAEIARIIGWAMAIWGTALYWCAAGLYLLQASRLLAADRAGPVGSPPA